MTESIQENPLHRLIYASKAKPELKLPGIKAILKASQKNNPRDEITGALFFSDDYFLQILEGKRDRLTQTFIRISQDDRHSNICLIDFTTCSERLFGKWALRHLPYNHDVFRNAVGIDKFDPMHWTADQCDTFFAEYNVLLNDR